MTEEMQTAMTEKGIAPEFIQEIISYADQIRDANVTQETLKASSVEITQEAVEYFNKIYQEAWIYAK